MNRFFLLFLIAPLFFVACNKDEQLTNNPSAKLNLSTDSVLFDTVFTSVGSTTRRLKIFNYNKKAINLQNISLRGGTGSPFAVNINGISAPQLSNLKINGNDSINVFVKVTINPTTQHMPFIVEDAIELNYNGNTVAIPLVAYGQNAIFLHDEVINTNTVWDSNLPYIVYNAVNIAPNATLTVAKGTRVLFHSNSAMNVEGTLQVNGTLTDSVVFASDRMERIYENESGQWNGIHFYGTSKNSSIDYAIIKNGITGIRVDQLSPNGNPKLLLTNSIVKNMEVTGLFGYHTQITAFNNLFFNCGQYLLYGIGGGNYNLKQNTFGAYNFNFARRTPAVYLSDYISDTEFDGMNANLTNNIIWGSLDNEYQFEKKTVANSTLTLSNNLLKTTATGLDASNSINIDPLFKSPRYGLFDLLIGSPAINKGISLLTDSFFLQFLSKDRLENTRQFPSELGCYEAN